VFSLWSFFLRFYSPRRRFRHHLSSSSSSSSFFAFNARRRGSRHTTHHFFLQSNIYEEKKTTKKKKKKTEKGLSFQRVFYYSSFARSSIRIRCDFLIVLIYKAFKAALSSSVMVFVGGTRIITSSLFFVSSLLSHFRRVLFFFVFVLFRVSFKTLNKNEVKQSKFLLSVGCFFFLFNDTFRRRREEEEERMRRSHGVITRSLKREIEKTIIISKPLLRRRHHLLILDFFSSPPNHSITVSSSSCSPSFFNRNTPITNGVRGEKVSSSMT